MSGISTAKMKPAVGRPTSHEQEPVFRSEKGHEKFSEKFSEKIIDQLLLEPFKIPAEMCTRQFEFFVREFWDVIIDEELIWNWHMSLLCNELEKVGMRVINRQPKEYDLIINIPPGTSKSTLATIMFPAWLWIKDASLRVISGSYSGILSLEHAEKSRDVIRSEKFKRMFPTVRIRKDKEAKSNYATTQKGARQATSVGGTVMGLHAHIIIIDDPLNPKQAMSTTGREVASANKWIDRSLFTRKVDKLLTPLILIMQRLHQNDPTGYLLKKEKKIRHICLPSQLTDYVSPERLKTLYTGGLLDKHRMSEEALQEAKIDLGSVGYAGQFLQRPVPEGGALFKVFNFKVVGDVDISKIDSMVRYWDKAGTSDGGKYSSGVLMGRLKSGAGLGGTLASRSQFVVLDVVRGQWSALDRERQIQKTAMLDGINVKVWTEQEPGSGGKESAENTISMLAGFSVYAEKVTGSKESRAEPYAAQVEAGNVLLLSKDWTRAFIDEHEVFPVGSMCDQVDAAAGAFNKLNRQKKVGVW